MEQAKVTHNHDGVMFIEGALTFDSVRKVFQTSLALLRSLDSIRIDLANVTHSDSAGLALLIEWKRVAKQNNKTISFENLPKQLLSLARVSKVETILGVEDNVG